MTKSILSILFIGAAVMLFIMYVQPTYDTVRKDKAKVARLDATLSKTREIQVLKKDLLDRFNNLFSETNLDRLKKMLPDHVDNVRLVLDMDGIASRYGIRIQNVSIKKQGTGTDAGSTSGDTSNTVLNGGVSENLPYRSLTLQFEVISTYDEFILLLHDLESSLRIVDLVSLSVKPRSGSGTENKDKTTNDSKPIYTFGVSLRTYWLP